MGNLGTSDIASPSARQLRALVDQTSTSMAMFDRSMRFLAVSASSAAWYGMEPAAIIGREVYDLIPGFPARWREIHRRGLSGEACRCDLDLFVRPDGTSQWLRWSVTPWHLESGEVGGIVISFEDVTRARQLQHSLDATESILNALFETVSIGLAITDSDGRFLRTNDAYRTLVGHDHAALRHMFVGSVVHPDDAMAAIAGLEPLRQGAETLHESRCRLIRPDGIEIFVEQLVAAIPGVGGAPMRMAVFARDVSERTALRAQLREADHLATVGRLGAGLAHDLGSLLFVFRSAIAGVVRAIDDPAQARLGRDSIAILAEATEYVERMTDALRALSESARPEEDRCAVHASVELADWWRRSSFLLQRAVPRGVGVDADFEPGMQRVGIQPAAMTQLMLNLVANAGHAIAERSPPGAPRGTVRLFARPDQSSASARIVVNDDGPGMTPDVERHAFEPYFSRRTDGAGSGIGLGLVKRAVEAVGGTIALESTVGVGTTVTMTLPFVG